MPKISVIVPTYNRCESLKDALDALLSQQVDGAYEYEVIVVDNNSIDRTREVIESFEGDFSGRLRYECEHRQGVSCARNRGIREAGGEIICFTDDDCIPSRDWLKKIADYFGQNEDVDVLLGGAAWEDGSAIYSTEDIFRGNGLNMSFRRSLFEEIGCFDVSLGIGSIGGSTEDVEMVYRAALERKKVVICDEIMVTHKNRLNTEEELAISYRDGRGYIICWFKHVIRRKDWYALKQIYCYFARLLAGLTNHVLKKDTKKAKQKLYQLTGALVGFFKAFYIWTILNQKAQICVK